MIDNPFGQVLVALVTPFTADGEVDWPAVEKLLDDVVTAGADGLVVTGTTGETSTLTDPEKVRLVEVGKDVAAGRAKIITGGGSNETAHAIELYKKSEKVGADGVMIVTPYYNKPTQAGILTHFRMIADATDLPVILYDIPGRTGVQIRYETILRASKHPNILAIKDAKGDLSEVSRVLNQTDLMYFAGDDFTRGATPSTAWRIALMCSGRVPQQPPTMLSKPSRAKLPRIFAMCSGVSS